MRAHAHTERTLVKNLFVRAICFSRKFVFRRSRNLLTISLSVGESLPKVQQINEFMTMALFDKIKHQICPEFMDNDTVTKAYTIHGNYFKEKGSMGKSSCQKSDLVTFIT